MKTVKEILEEIKAKKDGPAVTGTGASTLTDEQALSANSPIGPEGETARDELSSEDEPVPGASPEPADGGSGKEPSVTLTVTGRAEDREDSTSGPRPGGSSGEIPENDPQGATAEPRVSPRSIEDLKAGDPVTDRAPTGKLADAPTGTTVAPPAADREVVGGERPEGVGEPENSRRSTETADGHSQVQGSGGGLLEDSEEDALSRRLDALEEELSELQANGYERVQVPRVVRRRPATREETGTPWWVSALLVGGIPLVFAGAALMRLLDRYGQSSPAPTSAVVPPTSLPAARLVRAPATYVPEEDPRLRALPPGLQERVRRGEIGLDQIIVAGAGR